MPIVINDFEVVAEPPQPQRHEDEEQQPERAPEHPLRPHSVERALHHLRERQARLRAD